MKRFYISLSVLLLVLLFSNISFSQFKYENGIWIKNNTSTALTNVQVLIKFNTAVPIGAGWMQTDGKDIVFTSSCGGSTYLTHFVEGYLNTDSTKIWVKIPTLNASDSTLVYMYYGNPSATNLSTINVFDGPNSATDSVMVTTNGGSASTQRGFSFTANQDVIVGYFGKRVPQADQRYVTLFDLSTQAIIMQIQVDAGTVGAYNYTALTTPFWLRATKQYVLEVYQGTGDGYYYGTSSQIGQAFTYGSMLYCNSCTQNTYPTSSLANYHYGCPDLLYYTYQVVSPAPTARILPVADTTTPPAPTNLIATAGSGQATLVWNKSAAIDIAFYNVYKNTTNNPGTATLAGTATDSVFTATGLANGTWYFWVAAVDNYCSPKTSAYSTFASCTLGGTVYAVPELIYYRFHNNTLSPLGTPNFASAPVGSSPAPITSHTLGSGGQFDTCIVGTGLAGAVTPGWNWNVTGNWTISFWVSNLLDMNPTYLFGDLGQTAFRCFYGGAAGVNNMLLRGPLTDLTIACPMPASHVFHLVWDGTNVIVYMDGVLVNSNPRTMTWATGTGFKVAGYSTSPGLSGKMDEFRLYGRALTAAEIAATWNHELPYTVTGIGNVSSIIPDKFYLNQNYPNPFNPSTTIKYGLKKQSNVELTIYDAIGRQIKTLVKNSQPAGSYEVTFNAQELSSGVYFYRLTTSEYVETKKMMLVK